MLEASPHRLVLQVAGVDALQHDGQLDVAERHVVADPGDVPSGPSGPASRDALGIPGGALVTVMIYRIAERAEPKILTPDLWTLVEC